MDTFGFLPVASSLHEPSALAALRLSLGDTLRAIGGHEVGEDRAEDAAALVTVVLTGGTEQRVLAAWQPRHRAFPREPAILLAHAGQNSLPAAMEALARIRQLGGRGRIVYVHDGDDEDGLATVAAAVADLRVWRELATARIGLAGRPSDWLVASAPSPQTVRDAWGPQVVKIDLQAAIRDVGMARTPSVGVLAGAVVTGAGVSTSHGLVPSPTDTEVLSAASVYPWLRTIVERERLDAIAVRCFDLIAALKTSSCVAFAYLNDDGIVAGCEGDLVSTVAMLWLRRLLSETPWMANPVQLDPARSVVRLAHCTVPLSSVHGYRLRTHFESGLSVGIQGDLPPGPVTLVRIGGVDMRKLWLAEGDGLPTEPRDDLCRTQLDVRLHGTDVDDLLIAPLGNHIVTVPGHHAQRVRTWWSSFVAA